MMDNYNYGGKTLGLRHVSHINSKGKKIYAPCSKSCNPSKAKLSKTKYFGDNYNYGGKTLSLRHVSHINSKGEGMYHGSINNRRAATFNPWIFFVKEKANETGMKYPAVLADPKTRAEYYNSHLKLAFDDFRENRNPELYAPKKNKSKKKVTFN